jgi:adenylate cyclase
MNNRAESRELRALLQAIYQAWMTGGHKLLEFFSEAGDVLLIGTDSNEWVEGGRLAKAAFARQLDEMGAVTIHPGDIKAVVCGDMGWIADAPRFAFAQGETVHLRITAVAAREGFHWRIIHWHVSLGMPNADALGIELTTSLDVICSEISKEQPNLEDLVASNGGLTILFSDIVDSTFLNEALGDRQWLDLLHRHDQVVEMETSQRHGRVVKHQGDGYMLVFQFSDKALDAAIAIQTRLANDDALLRDVQVRMGLHVGKPIERRGDFFGRDVAYAARVAASANGREILVSAPFLQTLPRLDPAQLGTPRRTHFKGIEGPQQIVPILYESGC